MAEASGIAFQHNSSTTKGVDELVIAQNKSSRRVTATASSESGGHGTRESVVASHCTVATCERKLKSSAKLASITKQSKEPAGALVLDDDTPIRDSQADATVPNTYYRLALDESAKFGYKPVIHNGTWRNQNASRYIRKFQSRRSLLVWKIMGRRTDGWTNDDFPSETIPGDPNSLQLKGKPIANTQQNRDRADLDYNGHAMPPPEAVAGTYRSPDGKTVKVAPLGDEDRRTIIRWIDLGCPIDLDFDPAHPDQRGYGWMCDDNRPTLTVSTPQAGANDKLASIVVGMYDYYSGIDPSSFHVTADFAIDGVPPGTDLANRFVETSRCVWKWKLAKPLDNLRKGALTVSVKDRQGNLTRIERTFSVGGANDKQ